MAGILLQDIFVEELLRLYPKKTDLSLAIADILKIERESAIRRINGKVNFSINEMGIIACKLNISIDQLLIDDANLSVLPWRFCYPNGMSSMDNYLDMIKPYIKELKDTKCEYIEMGAIFHTFPLEFLLSYPTLCKFYYFKLGRYNIGSKNFSEFSDWQLPSGITNLLKEIERLSVKVRKVFYIWNYQTVSNWMNDVKYLYSMEIMNRKDTELIKNELHHLLSEIEIWANGGKGIISFPQFNLYISRLDLGISYIYHNPVGGGDCSCFLRSLFSYASLHGNSSLNVRSWIRSMRAVSTLISGTGEPERVLFFKEQHKIVDTITL